VREIPPVPPNSEFFVKDEGRIFFKGPWHSRGVQLPGLGSQAFDDKDLGWRKIIAAVARCAWTDEARSWQITEAQRGETTGGILYIGTCFNNAELWRKWGEQ
jgi:hypothetical protein